MFPGHYSGPASPQPAHRQGGRSVARPGGPARAVAAGPGEDLDRNGITLLEQGYIPAPAGLLPGDLLAIASAALRPVQGLISRSQEIAGVLPMSGIRRHPRGTRGGPERSLAQGDANILGQRT